MLQVIGDYARSWSLLQGYDEQSLAEQSARQSGMRALALDDALAAMAQLKAELIAKGEATELFGKLRGDGLAPPSPPSSRGLAMSCSIPTWPAGRRICCTSSSRTIRWPMATSARVLSCSSGICG